MFNPSCRIRVVYMVYAVIMLYRRTSYTIFVQYKYVIRLKVYIIAYTIINNIRYKGNLIFIFNKCRS